MTYDPRIVEALEAYGITERDYKRFGRFYVDTLREYSDTPELDAAPEDIARAYGDDDSDYASAPTMAADYLYFLDWLKEHDKEVAARAVRDAADDWLQHGWIDTPHYVDRVQDRFAAAQYAGDWLKQRANTMEGK